MKSVARFPWRLFGRIVLLQTLLVLVALTGSFFAARYFLKQQFTIQVGAQLKMTLQALIVDLKTIDPHSQAISFWCKDHASTLRLTVVDRSGTVLCDSHHDSASMDNHLNRPEIQAALSSQDHFGESIRMSAALGEELYYAALAPNQQALILRGAIPLARLHTTLAYFDRSFFAFLVLAALTLVGCAIWVGRSLASPIGRLIQKSHDIVSQVSPPHPQVSQDSVNPLDELSDLEVGLNQLERKLIQDRDEQVALLSALNEGIVAVNPQGQILFSNKAFSQLFSGVSVDSSPGSHLWEMIRIPEITDAFQSAFQEGKICSTEPIPHQVRENAPKKYYALSVAPLRHGADIYGAIGVFHDVTDLKLAEQIRIDFVANVSHELRTPLTSIKGYVDTLAQDLKEGREIHLEPFEVIQRNTARLVSLIQDLLDLSAIESGADPLQVQRIDLAEFTQKVLASMRETLARKQQRLVVQIQTQELFADPKRVEQVVINLLDNASKYSPPGTDVTISWTKVNSEIRLNVTDSGPGIPPEHRGRIFERFYRIDRARSRELGGTGLGLSIVKHILQKHGGRAWVEGVAGATFVCSFPRRS